MATQAMEQIEQRPQAPREIEVPASTAWPLVLAFGLTCVFAGLLTSVSVSLLGAVVTVAGCAGWFREVFPCEHEVTIEVSGEELPVFTARPVVERLPVAVTQVRAWLPVQTHPISAGIKGGLAGSIAMALCACLYGVVKAGSIWYPINLLAAAVYTESLRLGPAKLYSFHADSFAIALLLHLLVSLFVGLLYGAMLPMFSRRPILLGGLIAPCLWSGLLYAILGLLNPVLNSHIDWVWFMMSQAAFGVTAGLVVVRLPQVATRENVAFALRIGLEAPGTIVPREEGGER